MTLLTYNRISIIHGVNDFGQIFMKKDKLQTEIELMSELEMGKVVSQKALSQRTVRLCRTYKTLL